VHASERWYEPVRRAPARARALRGALAAACLAAAPLAAQEIAAARYAAPTERYPHAVLGDAIEHGALVVTLENGTRLRVVLPEALVFEDTAPRLVDSGGAGGPVVVTVESHRDRGARLAIWGMTEGSFARLAATPFIGTRFRWLAPAGAADLDGDGALEIAYVDRPHLARTLRVWRYRPGPPATLEPVAQAEGHTNHRIGDPDIAGGLRDCGAGPEIVTLDPSWKRIRATRLAGGRLETLDIGANEGPAALRRALACR
jgi:hypothetical protein